MRCAVVDDTANRLLVVVHRNELILAPRFLKDLRALQNVVVPNAVHRLTRSDAVCVVGVGVSVKRLKLSSLFPGQRVTEVLRRVALRVVLDLIAVVGGEQIVPSRIVQIFLVVLPRDITVVIVLHTVHDGTVHRLGEELSECVVGVLGLARNRLIVGSLVGLGYSGNSFLSVILICERSAVGQKDLADKLGSL